MLTFKITPPKKKYTSEDNFQVNRENTLYLFNELIYWHLSDNAHASHIAIDQNSTKKILFQNRIIKGQRVQTLFEADVDFLNPLIGLSMHLTGHPIDPTSFPVPQNPYGKIRILANRHYFDLMMNAITTPSHSRTLTFTKYDPRVS